MRRTKTYGFLLPLLKISKLSFQNRVINAYLGDDEFDGDPTYRIFVVHSNYQDSKFSEWENQLMNLDHIVASYDINESQQCVKVFDIPEEFHRDYEKFLSGKYSEMSLAAQKTVESFHGDKFYTMVFTKDPKRKAYVEALIGQKIGKQEVHSIPNIQQETLDKEKKTKIKNISHVKS